MACEDIQQKISSLEAQAKQIQAVLPNLKGAGLAVAQENLANIQSQIASEKKKLEDCRKLAQPAAARPFSARVKDIHCVKAGAEIGKQEPYVLIGTFDMLAQLSAGPVPVPVPKPAVQCFRVGPWSDLKAGSTASTSKLSSRDKPKFWDLNGQPRLVNGTQDVAFLAAVVEHDGASPDAIRGAVGTALEAGVVNNMGRAYTSFVDTMSSVMAGAIDSFAGAGVAPGHLNFDERLGPVEQISLTSTDLQTINALGRIEKPVTFRRKKKSDKVTDEYTVTFLFEA